MRETSKQIKAAINKARRRIFLKNLIQSMLLLLPVAAGLMTALIYAGQFTQNTELLTGALVLAGAAILAFLAYRALQGLGEFAVALQIDRQAGLADRISSALDFSRISQPTPMMALAVADAQRHSTRIDFKAAFPLRPSGMRNHLIVAALLVPVMVTGLLVDFSRHLGRTHTELSRDLPIDEIPTDVPDAPELARVQAPARLAPLIAPIRNYIAAWKQHVEKMKEEMARREKEFEEQVVQAIFADSQRPGSSGTVAGIRQLPTAITDDKIHLSDLQTMGINETSEYKDAFAEMDKIAFESEPDIGAVMSLQAMMKETADRKANSAQQISQGAAMAAQLATDADDIGAFRNSLQGAMQQSFNEFLRNYATHLSNVVETKKELVKQARQQGRPNQMVMSSAPPPPDAKLKMFKLGKDDYKQMQISPGAFKEHNLEHGVQEGIAPSTSKAGQGGGTAEGAIKTKKVDAQTNYVELAGQMGEGKSPIQILEDLDSLEKDDFSMNEYREIYADFTQNASEILDSEQIPLEIRSYIRDYFLSITPDRIGSSKDRPEEPKSSVVN